jgi:hypothetical protein
LAIVPSRKETTMKKMMVALCLALGLAACADMGPMQHEALVYEFPQETGE